MDDLDKIFRYITPFVSITLGLIVYIFRSQVLTIKENLAGVREYIASVSRKIDMEKDERKAELAELISTTRESIKDERLFRNRSLSKNDDRVNEIDKVCDKCLNSLSKIEEKIESMKAICDIRHTQK